MSIKHKTLEFEGNDFRIAYIDGVTYMCLPDTAKLLGLSGTAAFRCRIPKESIVTILPEVNYRNQRRDYVPFDTWFNVIRTSYKREKARKIEAWLIKNRDLFSEIQTVANEYLFHIS